LDTNGLSETSRRTVRPIVLAIAALTGLLVLWTTYQHRVTAVQPSLEEVSAEYAKLAPPPGASQENKGTEATTKLGSVLVSTRYITNDSFESIRDYYQRELPKEGWTFLRSLPTRRDSIDLYCKHHLEASIERINGYAPSTAFSLSLSWNGVSVHECG
jgi:hypothetical protein